MSGVLEVLCEEPASRAAGGGVGGGGGAAEKECAEGVGGLVVGADEEVDGQGEEGGVSGEVAVKGAVGARESPGEGRVVGLQSVSRLDVGEGLARGGGGRRVGREPAASHGAGRACRTGRAAGGVTYDS
jgi:hypothetical protein